jgi:hypothetical protein
MLPSVTVSLGLAPRGSVVFFPEITLPPGAEGDIAKAAVSNILGALLQRRSQKMGGRG